MTERIPIESVKLEGVGETNLKKLIKGGVTTLNGLAMLTSIELVSYTGMTVETAQKTIQQARDIISPGYMTGHELRKRQENQETFTTGSNELNRILGGGIHRGAINELIAEFGGGKTQIAMTTNVLSASQGKCVLVIDTEGTYMITRLVQMAESRGLDPDIVLSNTRIARAYNAEHLMILVNNLPQTVNEFKAELIILDSIIAHFRAEYMGLGNLAPRQQNLASVIHMLTRVSETFGAAVIVTNQVQTKPATGFGDPNRPAGGNIMGHGGTYRIMLRKGKMENHKYQTVLAQVIDSSHLNAEKIRFKITEKGVEDAED
jgi:DNA repair protein RadA